MELLTDDIGFLFEDLVQDWIIDVAIEYELEPVLRAWVSDECLFGAKSFWRKELSVKRYFQCIFQHVWNQTSQKRTDKLKTWIGINLNGVWSELIIKHEVEAEDLHAVQPAFWIQLIVTRSKDISGQFVHLGFQIAFKANIEVRIRLVEVHLELIVGKLVTRLVLAVVFGPLLHCIVGQVDQLVLEAAEYVLAARCTKIPFLIDVYFHVAVYSRAEDVCTNIKFPTMYQQWIVNVFLHNARPPSICG